MDTDTEAQSTPRVNSARLSDFVGRSVRLVCKVERVKDLSAIVRASDMGQVEVKMPKAEEFPDSFVEIIGMVEDANTIKLQGSILLGNDLDFDVVNDCITMMHNPQFETVF
ncbi:replication factor A protein 3 [Fomitiporia mediterranea MF3/22]|uniref:Replication factor A protein 3 n=1 Tax=Fomitiporia mediterranea (strain MF3/22) TaxID=694068 RepID=R7SGZ6_FOMME|nr:replication factor A protein 3 [Fomitiporia mediterranea MF3/22]EJC97680.1 replication factor A protein 3 [Fomitiporia mediterranea MF3/22]